MRDAKNTLSHLIATGLLGLGLLTACEPLERSSTGSAETERSAPTPEDRAPSAPGLLEEVEEPDRGGAIVIATPARVCREAGGTFIGRFEVPDLGGAHVQAITSVPLDGKLVKTGDQLELRIIRDRKALDRAALEARTDAFVVTKSGFSHVLLFSGETVKLKVFPGEAIQLSDRAMANFGRNACVKIRPERIE